MKFLNLKGEDFIAHWFRKSTYEETYNSVVYPINGQEVWEATAYSDVLPPTKRIMLGRPKKKRRLEPWELKKDDTTLRKGGIRKRCVVCREIGHNRTACPKKLVPPPSQSIVPATTSGPSQQQHPAQQTDPSQQHHPTQQTGPSQQTGPAQQSGPARASGPSAASDPSATSDPSQQTSPVAASAPSQHTGPAAASAPSQQTGPAANQSQPSQGQSQRASSNQFVQPMRNKLQARRGRVWKP